MIYYITSNLRIYQRTEKNMFPISNFKPIGNSAHTAEFLALGKAPNIYIEYLML